MALAEGGKTRNELLYGSSTNPNIGKIVVDQEENLRTMENYCYLAVRDFETRFPPFSLQNDFFLNMNFHIFRTHKR